MSLTAFMEDHTLATLATFPTSVNYSRNLHFYILDKNGSIINQAIFRDAMGNDYLVAAFKDKILCVANITKKKKVNILYLPD